MAKLPALAVDVKGLAKLVERRGKSFAVLELVQNAWDEDVTRVDVVLKYEGYNKATLTVLDDAPEGFQDLSHAYTLFAESKKKIDPEKRGRFNLGEKLVVALADTFVVQTTTGGVEIDVKNNERRMIRQGRDSGSIISATLRMTRSEVDEAAKVFFTLIPPGGIVTTFNGHELPARKRVHGFMVQLQTEIADGEGYLRPTRRMTEVEVYEPHEGESASIYEMGIPVVATGDRYHINVLQKVPLNTDRDNVTPAYLRDLRTHVLNQMASALSADDASSNWVNDALEDDLIEAEAVEAVMTKRFGEKRVIFDPSDPEANKIAASKGYTVIPGRSLSGGAWKSVKRFDTVKPAGQVTPSPKPYSEDGTPLKLIPEEKWTPGMRNVAAFAKMVGDEVLDRVIRVEFTSDIYWHFGATYGPGSPLVMNKAKLGNAFFDNGITEEIIDLLIHEFGHQYESDHLSRNYYKALTKIGAKLTRLALDNPKLFVPFK